MSVILIAIGCRRKNKKIEIPYKVSRNSVDIRSVNNKSTAQIHNKPKPDYKDVEAAV